MLSTPAIKKNACAVLLSALMLCACAAPQHPVVNRSQLPVDDDIPGADGALVHAIRQGDSQAAEAALQSGANAELKLCYLPTRPGYLRYGVFGQNPACRPASRMQPAGVPLLEVVLWNARWDAQAGLVSTLGRHGAKWDVDGTAVLGQLMAGPASGEINWDVRVATAKALLANGFVFSPMEIRSAAHTEAEFHRTTSLAFIGNVARLSGNTAAFDAEAASLDAQQRTAERQRQKLAQEKAMSDKAAIEQDRVVGTQICRTEQGISRPILGTAFGRPMYGPGVRASYQIVGFTEGVTPNKIRIRINSIQSTIPGGEVDNIDHLDGDPQLNVNGVIYDTPVNWRPCG